jgi:GDP-L-fucose synthase
LTGELEPTNEPYAIAKIAGIKLCEAFNRQYGTDYRAVMPTNLYGPRDNFDLLNSHVLPALIRKFHLARLAAEGRPEAIAGDETVFGPIPEDIGNDLQAIGQGGGAVRLWGSGRPRREFLHVDDLAAACLRIMTLSEEAYADLCAETGPAGSAKADPQVPAAVSFINVGTGEDLTIAQLARMVSSVTGYQGPVLWDQSRPDGTPRKLLDVTRLKKTGWKPQVPLEKGIGNVYDWYKKQASA